MLETLEQTNELKSVRVEKDTWILEVPAEICRREGFPNGTLVSLTLKNDAIIGEYLKPSQEIDDFVNRIVTDESGFFRGDETHWRLKRLDVLQSTYQKCSKGML